MIKFSPVLRPSYMLFSLPEIFIPWLIPFLSHLSLSLTPSTNASSLIPLTYGWFSGLSVFPTWLLVYRPSIMWLTGKEFTCWCRRREFDPWVGKIPWRRKWQPSPVFLPGESHVQRSWPGYNPWGRKERLRDWARMCITESCCCALKPAGHCKSTVLQ